MELADKKIAVTGATGFLGRNRPFVEARRETFALERR